METYEISAVPISLLRWDEIYLKYQKDNIVIGNYEKFFKNNGLNILPTNLCVKIEYTPKNPELPSYLPLKCFDGVPMLDNGSILIFNKDEMHDKKYRFVINQKFEDAAPADLTNFTFKGVLKYLKQKRNILSASRIMNKRK